MAFLPAEYRDRYPHQRTAEAFSLLYGGTAASVGMYVRKIIRGRKS